MILSRDNARRSAWAPAIRPRLAGWLGSGSGASFDRRRLLVSAGVLAGRRAALDEASISASSDGMVGPDTEPPRTCSGQYVRGPTVWEYWRCALVYSGPQGQGLGRPPHGRRQTPRCVSRPTWSAAPDPSEQSGNNAQHGDHVGAASLACHGQDPLDGCAAHCRSSEPYGASAGGFVALGASHKGARSRTFDSSMRRRPQDCGLHTATVCALECSCGRHTSAR